MSSESVTAMVAHRRWERPVTLSAQPGERPPSTPLADFEGVYLRNVDAVMGYFARRCADPHTVADLTSETFVRAMTSFASYDAGRGSDRAWVFGIAVHVFARHCDRNADGRLAARRLGGRRDLDDNEIEELTARIDAERAAAPLMQRYRLLPETERAAIELVDLEGLSDKEAATALGVSGMALRKRLSRARARLRKEQQQ